MRRMKVDRGRAVVVSLDIILPIRHQQYDDELKVRLRHSESESGFMLEAEVSVDSDTGVFEGSHAQFHLLKRSEKNIITNRFSGPADHSVGCVCVCLENSVRTK